jgi:uncharacterized membrane protein
MTREILTVVDPFLYTFSTVAYAIFCSWMLSLVHKFGRQHLDTDRHYAIAMLVFLILGTIVNGMHALMSLFRCIVRHPREKREDARRMSITIGILFLAGIAADVVFEVRAWTWFVRFQSIGDRADSIYSATYGVLAGLGILRNLLTVILGLVAWGWTGTGHAEV